MFLVKNYKAILLVLFAMLSEVIILPFSNTVHTIKDDIVYTYGDVLYYFFAQVGYISFLPSLFLYKSTKNLDSKGIYLGLVIWNAYEIVQEINIVLKLEISYLAKDNSFEGDILQIIYIFTTVMFSYIGYIKCRTSSLFLPRISYIVIHIGKGLKILSLKLITYTKALMIWKRMK